MDMHQKRKMRQEKKNNDSQESFSKVSISWYPGHMAKTKREIKEKIDLIDIVFEVVDARIPYSSKNKDIEEMTNSKPRVIIMTKIDLCDMDKTNGWIKYYEDKGYIVVPMDLAHNPNTKVIFDKISPIINEINNKRINKGLKARRARVLVMGVPNVGKSTFFNYIIGKKLSIVEDTPGVTRDRVYAETEWRDKQFTLIDTGGIEPKSNDIILSQMRKQVEIAIEVADVIIFLTDMKQGVTPDDLDIALMLKKSRKPIILVCNKADSFGKMPNEIYEFYNLGLGDPYRVSAVNALGIGDVLDAIYDKLPNDITENDDELTIKVAIIGRPNVGKSSLVNKILGENRVIVSDIAGTTRDATDSKFENEFGKYVFIDTAGIRKKSKVNENIEKYSVIRSLLAVERADVCILMLDATEGVTDQDAKIAGEAHEAGKGIIIVVNKWDEYEKENGTLEKYKKDVYNKLSYLQYAPILFISAKTGQRVHKLYELINSVASQNALRVQTSVLNQVLNEAISIVQPPTDKGKRLKIFYMTQASTKPPTFVVFVNDKELFHFSYERYLINQLRKEFGLVGTPVRIIVREKNEKDL